MEWAAPHIAGWTAVRQSERFAMIISMLGIDLGKTLCSIVGLDAGGDGVSRRLRLGIE
jgi:hypothetical protein